MDNFSSRDWEDGDVLVKGEVALMIYIGDCQEKTERKRNRLSIIHVSSKVFTK